MFLDRLRRRPMWFQIAWSAFISFGVLHLLVGVLVLVVMIRHHVAECDEIIALATEDLVREYAEYGGDASRLKLDMVGDVESHGNANLFLLVSSPSGRIVASASTQTFVATAPSAPRSSSQSVARHEGWSARRSSCVSTSPSAVTSIVRREEVLLEREPVWTKVRVVSTVVSVRFSDVVVFVTLPSVTVSVGL